VPVPRQRAIVLAAVKTKPSAALNRAVLTAAVRDGIEIERPGRENAPQGRTRECDGLRSARAAEMAADACTSQFRFPHVV
jgi:hypothetical protein